MSNLPPESCRRWYQFSLRTMLLGVMLLTIPLSWFAMKLGQARRQRAAVMAISKRGGFVYYDYEYDPTTGSKRDWPVPGPAWLRKFFGDDLFCSVGALELRPTDDDYKQFLPAFSHLRRLDQRFYGNDDPLEPTSHRLTDADVVYVGRLTELEFLNLASTKISDVGMQQLVSLTRLQQRDSQRSFDVPVVGGRHQRNG